MVRPGRYRETVTIEQATRTPDEGGGAAIEWSELAEVKAEVMPLRGREQIEAMRLAEQVDYRVRMWHRTDVTANHRLVWRGQALQIRAVTNPDMNRMETELLCQSGAAT